MGFSELWSRLTPGHGLAAVLAADSVVLGDETGLVTRVSVTGEVLSETSLPGPIRSLDADGDGHVAAICGDREVALLAGTDVVFRSSAESAVDFVRLGAAGDYLLVLSRDGEGIFLNRFGREMSRFSVPGDLTGAALVPRTGEVVTVSRDGTVSGLASWGKPIWRAEARPAAGAPSTDDRGRMILVPIMAYGVDSFGPGGRSTGAYDVGEPVKLAACSGDGEVLLFATSDDRLVLLRSDATVVSSEVFPASIESLAVSTDGALALLTTGSGYAHLLALATGDEKRYLEITAGASATRRPWRTRERVFSPYSLVVRPGIAFDPAADRVAIAGDRRRVQVLDLDGEPIALRRYGGSLIDLRVEEEGDVRVFATRSVFRFHPDREGTTPEWAGPGDVAHLAVAPDGDAFALTEGGEVLSFARAGGPGRRRFVLPVPEVKGIAAAAGRVAVCRKGGRLEIRDPEGERISSLGPWPVTPRVLAASEAGFLVGLARMVLLVGPDGDETVRHHLPSPTVRAVALPGAFLVAEEAGTAWTVTAGGAVRRVFACGTGPIVPVPDAGEGPGFLVADGQLLSVVRPDGGVRWRFRAADPFTHVAASADGRHVAGFAGSDLFVFPAVTDRDPAGAGAGAAEFLEFADG